MTTCLIETCDSPKRAKGLCELHYGRLRRYGDPLREPVVNKCSVEGCLRPYKCKGYCKLHYERLTRLGFLGDVEAKEKRVRPFSFIDESNGYEMYYPEGTNEKIYMHRYVMQQYLGRKLLPGENVHHKNGDRTDNRLENLELWSKVQPAGQRVSDKIRWAKEILELYGDNESAF